MPLWAWIALANCLAVLWVFTGVLGELEVVDATGKHWLNVLVRLLYVLAFACLGVLVALIVEGSAYFYARRQRRAA